MLLAARGFVLLLLFLLVLILQLQLAYSSEHALLEIFKVREYRRWQLSLCVVSATHKSTIKRAGMNRVATMTYGSSSRLSGGKVLWSEAGACKDVHCNKEVQMCGQVRG